MRDGRPRTRAELCQITGLARSTVGTRVDALLGSGLLAPSGEAASTGGRPPVRFAFHPAAGVVVGADLGATHGTVALTDLGGTIVAATSAPININSGPVPVLDWLAATARGLLASVGRGVSDLVGVGIGLPGPVEHSTGKPVNPPIMLGWHGYDVPERVTRILGGPVLVENDVNMMALGEHARIYPDVEHLIFVKVATGIGAGIISGGRLNRGAQGATGDLGHVAATNGGNVRCRCGNVGCLEAIASGAAIARVLRTQGLEASSGKDIVALVRSGDMAAAQAVRQAGREIGETLATCVSLLNPSVIVMGGVLAGAAESLLAGVCEVVYSRSMPLATRNLQIVAARTGGHAGVIGAATLVVQHVLSAEQVDAQLAATAS